MYTLFPFLRFPFLEISIRWTLVSLTKWKLYASKLTVIPLNFNEMAFFCL